ncbi:MAG TPA: hypothetical protein VGR03_11355 [Candidatus Acidoferrum sp.]|nr:hypothetical protein [Candidatus Acidoferrum sp.]
MSRPSDNGHDVNLGNCCVCHRARARVIVMLTYKCLKPGTGWGCVQCGLACDGASAIICERCAKTLEQPGSSPIAEKLHFAMLGYAGERRREPIENVWKRERHEHDVSKHADEL